MSSKETSHSPQSEVDPGLRVWNRSLVLSIVVAVLLGLGAIAIGYVVIGLLVKVGTQSISPAQRFTAAFAIATAMGVLVALVVNVRKQSLAEQVAAREITAAFTERFRAAAEQLGGESPAERLAGVYAMAALADEYPTRRQQCVDVLCGYLRLPFDPATDHLADRSTTTTRTGRDGRAVTAHESPASRPFDQQVRETIMTVIADHTRPAEGAHEGSWSKLSFNFDGAHLTNIDLSRCVFAGSWTNFGKATFSGEDTWFVEATFSGEDTTFSGATFSGEDTSFGKATFSGRDTTFSGATFSGKHTTFLGATFSGHTRFDEATFSGEDTSFVEATFSGWHAWFDEATFSGKYTSFGGATFSGDTSFIGATFSGGHTSFSGATFSGADTWFGGATFSGEDTTFLGATFSGKHTRFDEATFSGEDTNFGEAIFDGVVVVFDGVRLVPGTLVSGLAEPDLRDGASITKDGSVFLGWDELQGPSPAG